MSGHIINDFKDLRSLIGEVTRANPAKTTRQQNEKKMGVYKEAPEAKPKDDKGDRGIARSLGKKHAGEEEIKKAYLKLGRAAQGSVEYQKKLIQKELAKMGYKTYSMYAFDQLFKFETVQKWKKNSELAGAIEQFKLDESKMGDLLIDIQMGATAKELARDHDISLASAKNFLSDYYGNKRTRKAPGLKKEENIQEVQLGPNMLRKDFPNVWATKDSKLYRILNTLIIMHGFTTNLSSYKKDKKKFVDSLKNLAKSPAAQKRAGFGAKDMQYINKPKKGQSFWSQFDDDVEIDEAFNYTPKEFEGQIKAYKYKNGVKLSQVMKDFDDDWDSAFGNRGYDHDEVENGLKQALKKFRVKFVEDVQEGGMKRLFQDLEDGASAQQISKKYGIDMKTAKSFVDDYKKVSKAPRLRAAQNDPMKEENLQEGTWNVPDSQPKLAYLQKMFLSKRIKASEKNARTLLVNIYNIFGDDSFFDDVESYIENPSEGEDLRDVIVSNLMKWGVKFSGYKMTAAPEPWATSDEGPTIGVQKKFEDMTSEKTIKRGRGNIKKPKGKMVALKMSREDKLKEQKEQAKQSPFKLKSQAYPRAVSINTDGFGHRHATVEDIIAACDSFGMIIDKELQVEQVQKELGKNGFISFKQTDLEDVFDERETQRVILALETVVEEQDPIEYTRDQVEDAYIMGEEIEFLKPDGLKTAGKVLKLSGNTFNVKDKFTGKSFTYKYINEEKQVRTFTEVINEGRFPKKLVKQAMGIVWDKRYAGGNMTGAVKAIEKLKKGLSDDPDVSNALRLANEGIAKWIPEGGDKEAYTKFFNKALKKFGVNSPDELEGEKKKEFFDYVDKNWKGDHEEVNPSSTKIDGRRKNFKEKMRKLGYIKGN